MFVSTGCGITHWDRLLPGLIIIDESGLTRTMAAVLKKSEGERREIARTANRLAIEWNDDVMNRWTHILRDTVQEYAEKQH